MVNNLLNKVFREMGLTPKHARVYETLVGQSTTTPLSLARQTKLNRTSLYRYLEELRAAGLVSQVLDDKSSKYRAEPEALQQYLTKEESRLDALKTAIPSLVKELRETSKDTSTESEVRYYRGREGLRHMLWKMIASGEEYVGLGYQDWNTSVGRTFAEKLRAMNIESGAKSRELQNDDDNYAYTKLEKEYSAIYEHKTIDRHILEIKHDTYIYGDVFAYTYHSNGELLGVEIHNADIARTERQIFEILWKMGKPVR